MKDSDRASIDQGVALNSEYLPIMWRGLHDGCLAQGFTESQALSLVKAYILANGTNGISGTG